jgi:hypothetical protein
MSKLTFTADRDDHPTDVSYFMDCAAESMDIAYDALSWMRYFCPNPQLLQLVNFDPRRDPEGVWRNEIKTLENCTNAYKRWFADQKVDPLEKIVCVGSGLASLRYMVREIARHVADFSIYEGSKWGPFGEYTSSERKGLKPIRRFKPYRMVEDGAFSHEDGHNEIFVYDWRQALDQHYPRQCVRWIGDILTRYQELATQLPDEIEIRVPRPIYRHRDRVTYDRDERKAIRRGVELLDGLIGAKARRDFLNTKKLDIPGEQFTLRMTLEGLNGSHGGAKTQVIVNDAPVCNLCIYTPGTPTLDHIASMIVHVRAGLENDIIEIGNPYDIKAKAPLGIASLDERIDYETGRRREPEREPIVVDSIRMPVISPLFERLGNSPFAKKLQAKIQRRVTGHIYRTVFQGVQIPRPKINYIYELEGEEWVRDCPLTNADRIALAM